MHKQGSEVPNWHEQKLVSVVHSKKIEYIWVTPFEIQWKISSFDKSFHGTVCDLLLKQSFFILKKIVQYKMNIEPPRNYYPEKHSV